MVPPFLHNRPKFLVSHCMKRLPPTASRIPVGNIVMTDDGVFSVQSVDSDNVYTVRMCSEVNFDMPSCDCTDWRNNCLPCKHLLAVIIQCPDAAGWDSLPRFYRHFPLFNVDENVVSTTHVDSRDSVSVPHSDHVEPLETESVTCTPAESDSGAVRIAGLQSRLRQLLTGMTDCTYSISDVDFLVNTIESASQMLQSCQEHVDPSVQQAAFRTNRRMVRGSIRAAKFRRRMSVLRAKRRRKKTLRRRKVCQSGKSTTP